MISRQGFGVKAKLDKGKAKASARAVLSGMGGVEKVCEEESNKLEEPGEESVYQEDKYRAWSKVINEYV